MCMKDILQVGEHEREVRWKINKSIETFILMKVKHIKSFISIMHIRHAKTSLTSVNNVLGK